MKLWGLIVTHWINKLSQQLEILIRRHRVIPRIILGVATYHLYIIYDWSITLPDISVAQAGMIAGYGAVYAGIIKFYQDSAGGEKDIS